MRAPVRPIHWFERLLAELGHELWIGDSARIRTNEVRKQKTDVRDARLILDLLLARRLPKIWVRPLKEYEAAGGRAQWLEMLEDVGDFLAGFFGVVDGDVFALFGADHGIAANGLAGVYGGMLRNFEGFLCAIRSLHGDGLRAFADIFHGALGGVHRFITNPLNGMSGLGCAFASGVDDDVAAFLAGEVGSLGGILQAVNGGFVGELNRFDGAIGGLHGNCFCSGINFFDGAGDDVGHILRACYGDSEAGREEHEECPEWGLKKTGSHRFSLEYRGRKRPFAIIEKGR